MNTTKFARSSRIEKFEDNSIIRPKNSTKDNIVSQKNFSDECNGQSLIPSMGRRMLAYMIDYAIVFTASLSFQMLLLWIFTKTPFASNIANLYFLAFIFITFNGIYHISLESNKFLQGTLGKVICGLKVIDIDTDSLDINQALKRFIWRIPSIVLMGFPYLIAARGSYGMALHDIKSFTIVTTRGMNQKNVASGLLVGRKLTKKDKISVALVSSFLIYVLFDLLTRFL